MPELSSTSASERAMRPGETRHVVIFLFSLAVLFGLLVAMTSQLVRDLRMQPYDFASMQPYEVMFPARITRRQEAQLKVGFAEHSEPTAIGLFGNHQVQYFDTDAFEAGDLSKIAAKSKRRPFFNHWFADLTLVDMLDYLTYLESINRLPSDLIIVGITTPNNDNGMHIIGRSWYLPPDLRYVAEKGISVRQFFDLVAQRVETVLLAVRYYTDYMSAISAISGSGANLKPHDTRACKNAAPIDPRERRGPLAGTPLPGNIVNMFAPPNPLEFCWTSVNTFRVDGATAIDRLKPVEPVLDENPLDPRRTALHSGDDLRIAQVMKEIDAIGKRTGRKVVFLIPPVYETERVGVADSIFSSALALVPELDVFDHRHHYKKKENFWEYDHPGRSYYRVLADMIMKKYF